TLRLRTVGRVAVPVEPVLLREPAVVEVLVERAGAAGLVPVFAGRVPVLLRSVEGLLVRARRGPEVGVEARPDLAGVVGRGPAGGVLETGHLIRPVVLVGLAGPVEIVWVACVSFHCWLSSLVGCWLVASLGCTDTGVLNGGTDRPRANSVLGRQLLVRDPA